MKRILLIVAVLLSSIAYAQECDYILDGSEYNTDASKFEDGADVCVQSNKRLIISNAKNITITGYLVTSQTNGPGLKFQNCENVVIKDMTIEGGTIAMQIQGNNVHDVLIDGCEISGYTFAGIMLKDDNAPSDVTYSNVTIQNCKMDGSGSTGEAFYIGNSFFSKGTAHELENIKVLNNEIQFTGAEGIQMGCVVRGGEIAYNTITRAGDNPFDGTSQQSNSIQVGEGSGMFEQVKVHHNYIYDGSKKGNGIIVLGAAYVYNNRIRDTMRGLFVDDRPNRYDEPNPYCVIVDNVFYNIDEEVVLSYYSEPDDLYARNTIVDVRGDNLFRFAQGSSVLTEDNVEYASLEAAGLTEELLPIDGGGGDPYEPPVTKPDPEPLPPPDVTTVGKTVWFFYHVSGTLFYLVFAIIGVFYGSQYLRLTPDEVKDTLEKIRDFVKDRLSV